MRYVLLSHVLIAFAKCPPSTCAHSDVKSRFSRSATGKGCFGAAFCRVLVAAAGLVACFAVGLGGMAPRRWTYKPE